MYIEFKRMLGIAGMTCAVLISPMKVSAADVDLDAVKQAFVSGVASQFRSFEHPWAFLDMSKCFEVGATCSGTNPDSPYGYVNFHERGLATRMAETDTLVLIMKTPPPMRYFAVTPYLYTRYYPVNPTTQVPNDVVKVFESLGDSVNNANIKTTGSAAPGQNAFDQLSIFVMTTDSTGYKLIHQQFVAQGVPEYAINQLALPFNAVPLNMGSALTADTFSVLLRIAYPDDATRMHDYINSTPVRALVLSPLQTWATEHLPDPISKTPGNGVSEDPTLADARDQLVRELRARYRAGYNITENKVEYAQTINYICAWTGTQCGGDNPDAIYGKDLIGYAFKKPEHRILIVGINHVDTGKARYISHAVVNAEHQAGVVAINDGQLRGSALRMAGITDPNDPRYAAYSKLYAFTISYDCKGEPDCLTIPVPTPEDPAGVALEKALNITSRYYVDPATGTRPKLTELLRHRVLVMEKK